MVLVLTNIVSGGPTGVNRGALDGTPNARFPHHGLLSEIIGSELRIYELEH
jgi:hypothetical protein